MKSKRDRLKKLRRRAEDALKSVSDTPNIDTHDAGELVHELHVYHAELELQIEDLRQAYQKLETIQKRYTSLFNFAPVGYITTDARGKIMDANLMVIAMLDTERAALKNMSFAEIITEDYQDIYHLHRRSVARVHQMQTCEVQIRSNDGTVFHAQLHTHIPDRESEIFYTAIIDISAIKQTQQALQQALAQEKQLNQLRTRVLSVIGHEFRTPLTSILSSAELLEHYGERMTDDKKKSHHRTIRNMIWYLNDVVQEISAAQEFNNDVPQLKLKTFELPPFVNQLIDDMLVLTEQQQQITLHTNRHDDSEMVTWDQNLLRRILMNLIGNALKYSDDEVTCYVDMNVETVCFRIEDRGTGISEDDQQHMYDAFYRGENAEFIPGTGIGLYVVAQAVEAHGGSIDCESAVERGTTFNVNLPRHATSTPPNEA